MSELYKDFDADLDLDEQIQDYDGLRHRLYEVRFVWIVRS